VKGSRNGSEHVGHCSIRMSSRKSSADCVDGGVVVETSSSWAEDIYMNELEK
jgi:hypothetical protein